MMHHSFQGQFPFRHADSFTVEGTYVPLEGMATIPDDLIARVYFQDGLRGSSSVAASTGFFAVPIMDVPYGLHPFIVTFVSESYVNEGGRSLIEALTEKNQSPKICMCINNKVCGPAFSLTLTWDTPTADVDLHVYEPGGKHVYFGSTLGDNGAYLDFDDTEGFGPEHYYVPTAVFNGSNYQIFVDMYSYDQEVDTNVNWTLVAHSYGEQIWTISGMFRNGVTPERSDPIPWIFDEEPVCKDKGCDSCGILPSATSERRLAITSYVLDSAPSNWIPANIETDQFAINWHYNNYVRYELNPLWSADLLNRAAACVLEYLTADEKQRIVNGLGSTKDINTAIAAANAIYNEFEEKRNRYLFPYVCRHHALALHSVLVALGFDASVEAAESFKWGAKPHTWIEVIIDNERYILDAFYRYYIRVLKYKGPGCIYTSGTHEVGCTSQDIYAENVAFDFICSTANPSWALPKGRYFIGDRTAYHHVGWYNLYAERQLGDVWDYSTRVPEKWCRGGFGFHEGTASNGCITVQSGAEHCFGKVEEFVGNYVKDYLPRRYETSKCNPFEVTEMAKIALYHLVVLSN
jgi:hypothetical protein